jgi:hypothetical protein
MESLLIQRDSVYRRITAILGVDLNRSELVALVKTLSLVPLGRSEKRVKALLIRRLEEARTTILPLLQTQQGIESLERAYLDIVAANSPKEARTEPIPLPPEATVEFYLNKPHKTGRPSE